MRKLKIGKRIVWTLMILLFIALETVFWGVYIMKDKINILQPKAYEGSYYDINWNKLQWKYCKITERELKVLIDDLYRTPYIYIVNDNKIGEYTDALSNIMFRLVFMKSEYENNYDYGISLAHELTHIKYATSNEAWVEFKTFTLLYESKSEILHNLALIMANGIMYRQYTDELPYNYNYEVSYYVAEYLEI